MSSHKRSQLLSQVATSLAAGATQAQLKAGGDAAMTLAQLSVIWQDSYNALEKARLDAQSELRALETRPLAKGGAPLADIYAHRSLIAKLDYERTKLERARLAFSIDELVITAPTSSQVAAIKEQCAIVELEALKSQNADHIAMLVSALAGSLATISS